MLGLYLFLGLSASTLLLTGLIWTIQCVHYPAFRYVHPEQFVEFEAFHQKRVGGLVVPLMTTELLTSIALLGVRPHFLPWWWAVTGLTLVVAIWAGTFLVQVPLHRRLATGYDPVAIQHLARSNRFRTAVWTVRSVLILYGLWRAILPMG